MQRACKPSIESLERRAMMSATRAGTRALSPLIAGPLPFGDAAPAIAQAVNAPGNFPLALTADALGAGGIRLNWQPLNLDSSGQIVIFRKALNEPNWPQLAIAEPAYNATSFTDSTAQVGQAYEYRVVVYAYLGSAPMEKYVYAGNGASPVSSRGTVLLVVDSSQLDASRDANGTTLLPTLQNYQADLIREGYRVQTITAPRVDVPRTQPTNLTPAGIAAHFGAWSSEVMTLKQRIRNVWQATPDLKTVVLIGHVAVPYSGVLNPDGSSHAEANGAWATDAFYSVLSAPDSLWTDEQLAGEGSGTNVNLPGDGKFDQDSLVQVGYGTEWENNVFSDVAIGRIDFSQMHYHKDVALPAGAAATPGETLLLANYFARNHAFRTGEWDVRRLALFEEQFPFPEYYDTNLLTPNVGFDGVVAGTVSPVEVLGSDAPFPPEMAPANSHDLATNTWMWLYASAGGYPSKQTIHFSPTRELRSDQYVNGAESSPFDIYRNNNFGPHKAVFNLIYGSYVGDTDGPNNLLRSVIAEVDGLGLAAAWGARPNWEQHHMALGEPMGLSLNRTINNFAAREAYGYDPYQGSVRLSIVGDPTLREANVKPATNVRTSAAAGGGTQVNWTASADPTVAGYYVYRASSPGGPFTQVSATMQTGTSFVDATPGTGERYYLVRAARLESTPSGTYWNLAMGAVSAPRVTSASFKSTFGPHAATVVFDQDVSLSLATSDLVIAGQRFNFSTRQMVPATLVAGVDYELASYNEATRTAQIVFHVTSIAGVPAGQVPSGRFNLSFVGGGVSNAFGASVDASFALPVNYLTGDTNGDLDVDFDDLLVLARNYSTTTGTLGVSVGDLNGDGKCDFDDLLLLAKNYNTTI